MDYRIIAALIVWIVADVFRDRCSEIPVGRYYKETLPWWYNFQHSWEFSCLWLPMFLILWAVYGLWTGLGITMVGGGVWMCAYSWSTHGNPFAPDEIFFPFLPDERARTELSGSWFLILVFTLILGGLFLSCLNL